MYNMYSMNMSNVVSLIIPFIVLVIFGTMVDKLTVFLEMVMQPIPYLPNKLTSKLAFVILVLIGFGVCYEFEYNLFAYLGHPGRNKVVGYLFTAVLIAGGSSYLKQNFDNINSLPGILSGLTSSFGRFVGRSQTSTQIPVNPVSRQVPLDLDQQNNNPKLP